MRCVTFFYDNSSELPNVVTFKFSIEIY